MKYFHLKEVPISDEMLPLIIYRGLEQDKIKIHHGYFVMKQAITALVLAAKQADEYHVIYKYEDEILTTIFGVPDSAEKTLQSCMPGAVWEEIHYQKPQNKHDVLVGSADPTIMEEKEESLIESVINAFPGENFIMDFVITAAYDNDIAMYLAYLDKTIQLLSKNRSLQFSLDPKLSKKFTKAFWGGLNENLQSELANADVSYTKYRQHYNAIHSGKFKCTLRVEMYADKELTNNISNAFQGLSANSGFISGHHLYSGSSHSLKVNRHERPWMRYINVIDPSKQEAKARFSKKQLEDEAKKFIDEWKEREFKDYPEDFKYISVTEAASLLALPFNAQTGLTYKTDIKYGTEPHKESDEIRFNTGYLTTKHQTNIPIEIDARDLTRHALVTGVTGSGKTTTIKHLLRQCLKQNIPFLVIEPAKAEYANWIHEDICVHRLGLGNDSLKMNPLAFPKGIHVQTHLDNIKSVFNAAFPMYGPMPYLLETALLKAYQNRGWDLVTGININEQAVPREFCFPTIEELRDLIDQVTTSVGYSQDLTSDVRGALRVRLGSLMVGAKGQLFNTRQLIDLQTIMQKPTVLGLEAIGDSQEKVFLMGLLLIQIYEYYVAQGSGSYTESLKHLLVFEEAHRLWENRQEAVSQETVDVKGNAVQTMNQILSEIRAYGQGILIADQIPSKLAPDAVKNTNLKIIHRLFAQDDREWVGKSIGLDDDQIDDLVNLKTKEGVVFWDGLAKPVKVHIEVEKTPDNNIAKLEETVFNEIEVMVNILMASEEFNKKAEKLLRTVLVIPNTAARIQDGILDLIRRFQPEVETNENVIARLLLELIVKQLNNWYSLGLINLTKHYVIINSLKILTDISLILEEYIRIWDSITSSLTEVPIFQLIPQAKYIEYLLPEGHCAALVNNICHKLENSYHTGHPITTKSGDRWRELNHILNLKSYFAFDILSESQKNLITDAAVVSLLREYTDIVDAYMNVANHLLVIKENVFNQLQRDDEKIGLNELSTKGIQNLINSLDALASSFNHTIESTPKSDKTLYYLVFFMGIVNVVLALSIWIK